jgi:hypothetical protein
MEARLKAGVRVKALIRRCDLAAIGVAVTARGDPDAGAILIRLDARNEGSTVLSEARSQAGALVWLRATGPMPVSNADADAYIDRQRRRDPDLWVIEIDAPSPVSILDDPVID